MLSVCSYLLAGFGLNKKSSESALKYVIFGAFSSALMLYGMSLLYGMTGTLNITYTDAVGQLAHVSAFPLMLAVVLTVCGFLFKIAAVPFHSWSPDVYEGAPVSIVAFFSVAPKLGGLVVLYDVSNILLHYFNAKYVVSWSSVVAVIALASMIVGNTAALQQQNMKRMLAYSSIAQAGFMLCCVVAYSGYGSEMQALTFYAIAYMLANFVVFALLAFTGKEQLQDYSGTGKKYVFVSVAVLVAFLALTGLPPTGGFMAKFLVFTNLWQAWVESGDKLLLILFIGGILNAVISLFYYVKLPYYAFFKPENETQLSVKINAANYAILALLTLFSLLLFFKADGLLVGLQ
jgi:NADH-quinone oxidoreductase subunit N